MDPFSYTSLLLLLPAGFLAWGALPAFAGAAVLAAERGTPARLDRRTTAVLVREASIRAVFAAARPLGAAVTARRGPWRPEDPLPVLLVGRRKASLAPLKAFLVHRGHTWVEPLALPASASLDGLAQHVGQAARRVARESGAALVHVVAHGDVGLAAAWFVRHLDGDDVVARLVTLGTPWRGTRMAVFRRGALASALLPGAPVLDDLVHPHVPTVAIWSTDDPWVVPSDHALPEGAQSVQIEGAGHVDLLASARAFRAVREALAGPGTG